MTLSPVRSGDNADRAVWHLGALIEFDATAEQTGGCFAVTRHTCRHGTAAPLHRHEREDEVFIVLAGELSVHIAGHWFRVPTGSTLFAPCGVPHAYRVESPVCRFLAVITPGGFEQWFTDTGTPAETLSLPPAPTEPPDVALLVSAAARHNVEILGPTPDPASAD
ncbi:cupin domain-containing protein [Nocardia abscessus]|uniref:cupin domain-containing protein n=1 Tax=Nocardia abscessus TaxID=120957 RepID=UPI001894549E|nr:cupin domain-containing protein [Nocardia abscessus]MBF6338215.1 cupin domain-containing protein [Nocardia abscessus]